MCLEICLRKINLLVIRRVSFKDVNLETGKLVKRQLLLSRHMGIWD